MTLYVTSCRFLARAKSSNLAEFYPLMSPHVKVQCRLNLFAWGYKPPPYVSTLSFIALAYGMEITAGEDGIKWEPAKLKPL